LRSASGHNPYPFSGGIQTHHLTIPYKTISPETSRTRKVLSLQVEDQDEHQGRDDTSVDAWWRVRESLRKFYAVAWWLRSTKTMTEGITLLLLSSLGRDDDIPMMGDEPSHQAQ